MVTFPSPLGCAAKKALKGSSGEVLEGVVTATELAVEAVAVGSVCPVPGTKGFTI